MTDIRQSEKIIIYTDGSSLGNPGPGGYGILMRYKNKYSEFSNGFRKTTNNRMELMAVIEALKLLKTKDIKIELYTDSKYVSEAINAGWINTWKRKGFKKVKNLDLWKEFIELYPSYNIKFIWVKGHVGNVSNERCDYLAREAARNPNAIDTGYELLGLSDQNLFNRE